MPDAGEEIIRIAHNRMVREVPKVIRDCLAVLSEEQVWWRPNEQSNAVGNLVIHVCGATRLFLGKGVGGVEYVRDRDREFAERGPIPTGALLTLLEGTVEETDRILAVLAPGRLFETTRGVEPAMTVLACLMRMSHHWAYHGGQVVTITKLLREGSLDDVYRRAMVK